MTDTTPTLEAAAQRTVDWLDKLTTNAKIQAGQPNQFESLREALTADAKNYQATAKHLRTALAAEQERREAVRELVRAATTLADAYERYEARAIQDEPDDWMAMSTGLKAVRTALTRCKELGL